MTPNAESGTFFVTSTANQPDTYWIFVVISAFFRYAALREVYTCRVKSHDKITGLTREAM
jgi:hypothetical protein